MLSYLYGQDEVVAKFVASMIPHLHGRGFGANDKAIGVLDEDGRLIAGMVYHNWDPEAGIIELTGASTTARWLQRPTLARLWQYPFLQFRCQMIVQRTPIDNERLLRQLAVGNYTFIKVPRMFGRERDGVICCLTYENWASNRFNTLTKQQIDAAINAIEQEAA